MSWRRGEALWVDWPGADGRFMLHHACDADMDVMLHSSLRSSTKRPGDSDVSRLLRAIIRLGAFLRPSRRLLQTRIDVAREEATALVASSSSSISTSSSPPPPQPWPSPSFRKKPRRHGAGPDGGASSGVRDWRRRRHATAGGGGVCCREGLAADGKANGGGLCRITTIPRMN